jgi:hypothetical protein
MFGFVSAKLAVAFLFLIAGAGGGTGGASGHVSADFATGLLRHTYHTHVLED